ncbi:MAG: bifunctional adenosylcobinamide kinase/adenosylcobinamide-phosphate guanylyltransferase, partial [Betaproteobacteria bacterium]|nr:bifunctional adenosylcobinamide kinase/adenosylcobinamide-phosphate guanylyltransferase [Betaproteobacteria bacterium]
MTIAHNPPSVTLASLSSNGLAPDHCELILGGQKSGKSRRAEQLALQWLQQDATHRVVLLATALAGDAEMAHRIARHQQDRQDCPQLAARLSTYEVPHHLARAIAQRSQPQVLVVVDCLTLWLTNWLMPLDTTHQDPAQQDLVKQPPADTPFATAQNQLLAALGQAPGPVVLVSNEIGLGVVPMGEQVRHFVDALGV